MKILRKVALTKVFLLQLGFKNGSVANLDFV